MNEDEPFIVDTRATAANQNDAVFIGLLFWRRQHIEIDRKSHGAQAEFPISGVRLHMPAFIGK